MNTTTSEHTRMPLRAMAIVALGVFVLLFARAMGRPLDLDEHQFVSPAQLMHQQGLRPYIDFPLFHMPMLVCIYDALLSVTDHALLITRTFAAACGAATAFLILVTGWNALRHLPRATFWQISLAAVALFITSRVFTWTNGRAWNHDPSTLALFAATLLQIHAMQRGRVLPLVAVGLLLGVAVTVRLTTAPGVGALAIAGLILPSPLTLRQRLAGASLAFAGFAFACIPTIRLAMAAPDQFLFGNLGYPRLYREYVLHGDGRQYTLVGKALNFLQTWLTDPSNAVIALTAAISLGSAWRFRHRPTPAAFAALPILTLALVTAFLFVGVAAPFQIQYQYHSVLLPFFIAVALYVLGWLAAASPLASQARLGTLARAAACIAVAINAPRWYWSTFQIATPSRWTPNQTRAIGVWLRTRVPADTRVLTIDPLIALEAGLRVYPEYATGRFTFHVGPYATDEVLTRAKLAWGPRLDAMLAQEPASAIFYRTDLEPLVPGFVAYARTHALTAQASPDGRYTLWVPARHASTATRTPTPYELDCSKFTSDGIGKF